MACPKQHRFQWPKCQPAVPHLWFRLSVFCSGVRAVDSNWAILVMMSTVVLPHCSRLNYDGCLDFCVASIKLDLGFIFDFCVASINLDLGFISSLAPLWFVSSEFENLYLCMWEYVNCYWGCIKQVQQALPCFGWTTINPCVFSLLSLLLFLNHACS